MRRALPVVLAVILGLIIRLALLASANGISLDGFEAVLHIDHIIETGLPMTTNTLAWGGAQTMTMPLFHYLLAFLDLFLPRGFVLLVVPNLFMSLLPIPVYLLASQVSRNQNAAAMVTLASVFVPLLYQQTLLTVTPLSLAIPLLLLAYYYFIRIERTPRDQKAFALTAVALTLTHPISLLLPAAMALTLLVMHVQRLRMSRTMAEATIFTSFLTIWASSIVYKDVLQHYGFRAFFIGTRIDLTLANLPALVGVVALLGGAYGAYRTLTDEKNVPAHAMTALVIVLAVTAVFRVVRPSLTLMLLSVTLLILSAAGIEAFIQARERARIRGVHSALLVLFMIAFIFTSAIPSIALGVESYTRSPDPEEQDVMAALEESIPVGNTIYWDAAHGHYLQAHGFATPVDQAVVTHPRSQERIDDLRSIHNQTRTIRVIETLNRYDVDAIILPSDHGLTLPQRCFWRIYNDAYEVYLVRCVVQ